MDLAKLDSTKKVAFLAALAEAGTISAAAKAAGVSRESHRYWLRHDPDYPELFQQAREESNEALENEARRRAVEGWDEPVFYEGCECGTKRKYSDTMLAMLLNGNMPEKYARQRVEHSGRDGGPIEIEHRIQELRGVLDDARSDKNYAELERQRAIEDSSLARLNGHSGEPGSMENGSASRDGGPSGL